LKAGEAGVAGLEDPGPAPLRLSYWPASES